jgi:hypothetical protein
VRPPSGEKLLASPVAVPDAWFLVYAPATVCLLLVEPLGLSKSA